MYIYIYMYILASVSLQVYGYLGCCDQISSDFPKDAIHGVQREVPDVHVYYQWLLHQESGVKYSHYDLLLPTSSDNPTSCDYTFPAEVEFAACESQPVAKANVLTKFVMSQFFDSETYAGRTYQFPELKGKVKRVADALASWSPADASVVRKLFDSTAYEGKTNHQFEPLKGRLIGHSELTRERFNKHFNITTAKPSTHEASDTVAPAQPSQTESESKPQSLEVASVMPPDVGQQQISPVSPHAQSHDNALIPKPSGEAAEAAVSMPDGTEVPEIDATLQFDSTPLEEVKMCSEKIDVGNDSAKASGHGDHVEPLQIEYAPGGHAASRLKPPVDSSCDSFCGEPSTHEASDTVAPAQPSQTESGSKPQSLEVASVMPPDVGQQQISPVSPHAQSHDDALIPKPSGEAAEAAVSMPDATEVPEIDAAQQFDSTLLEEVKMCSEKIDVGNDSAKASGHGDPVEPLQIEYAPDGHAASRLKPPVDSSCDSFCGEPSTHEASDTVAPAQPSQTESGSKPQSLEVASVMPPDVGQQQISPASPHAQSHDNALIPKPSGEAAEAAVSMPDATEVPEIDAAQQFDSTSLEEVKMCSEKIDVGNDSAKASGHGDPVEPLQIEYAPDGHAASLLKPPADFAIAEASSTDSLVEDRLFRLFRPLLNNSIVPIADAEDETSDDEQSTGKVPPPPCEAEPNPPVSGEKCSKQEASAMVPLETDQNEKDCFAIRLPTETIQELVKASTAQCVFKFKHKLEANTMVGFVGDGQVIATARFASIDVIESHADLRVHPAFQAASKQQKDSWREAVAKEKKKLYVWTFIDMKRLAIALEMSASRGRTMWISLHALKPYVDNRNPGMDLRETCEFFNNRLPDDEYRKLGERIRALDGKTISIGSTCSGTDVCVNVMKATMAKLNEVCGVSRQHELKEVPMGWTYIYIYTCVFM